MPKRKKSPVFPVAAGVILLGLGSAAVLQYRMSDANPPGNINQVTIVDSLIDSGKLDIERGQYDSAVSKLTSALELAPKSGPAFLHRAEAYWAKGDASTAYFEFLNARPLTVDPESLQKIDSALRDLETKRLRVVTHHSPGDERIAQSLVSALQRYGYKLDKPEAITSKYDPGVRFFYEEDRQAADKLRALVTDELSRQVRLPRLGTALLQSQSNVVRGTIEIWLPSMPLAAK